MASKCDKVVVAMSGGVDSSVAACLLVEQGYDVVGLFMRVGVEEPVEPDAGTGAEPQASACADTPETPAPTCANTPEPHASACAGEHRLETGATLPAARDRDRSCGAKPAARIRRGCCGASDAADARYVAGMLGVPFYALNFADDFDAIIDYFADEYVHGRTPNPCVICNDRLKFGRLVEYADAVGARFIATGHYARIEQRHGSPALMRGRDTHKDQSYVLFGLERGLLERTLLPVGEMAKDEVREAASRFGLPNRNKPDSVEICFAPDRNYARVVRERRPEAFAEGDVVDETGCVVGKHKGIGHYTIGQRRGLGIAAGHPIYVTRLDAKSNRVTVGEVDALMRSSLVADRVSFLVDGLSETFVAQVKIRYLHTAAPAIVHMLGHGKVRVEFEQPQRAVTPGQPVVFYDDDVVLGGAWIEGAELYADAPE